MSGMLDLSMDAKAKHFLPRWLKDAPTWIRVDLSMIRNRSCMVDVFFIVRVGYCALNLAISSFWIGV